MRDDTPSDRITAETIIVASDQQVSCDLLDEAVVLGLRDGVYYGMNPVAARVWELIQQPCTVASVRDVLLEEFDGVSSAECERAVIDLLVRLEQWQLVSVAARP